MDEVNPRAVVGDNRAPDAAQMVTDQMRRDYQASEEALEALLAEARALPKEVDGESAALANGAMIKRFRDLDGRLEAFRVAEKEPHLRAGNAVDAFFFSLRDKIGRRNKADRNARPGAADVLQARNDDWIARKLAAERAERDRQAAEAMRLAREARERAEAEARRAEAERAAAEEARLAAERARKPETTAAKAAAAEEREQAADDRAQRASVAAAEAQVAAAKAEEARIATLAKPADMVRTRGDDGVLLTAARENYAILVDRALLDKEALWPFFTDAEVEKALRAWARTTGHGKPMAGAEIGNKSKGVVR